MYPTEYEGLQRLRSSCSSKAAESDECGARLYGGTTAPGNILSPLRVFVCRVCLLAIRPCWVRAWRVLRARRSKRRRRSPTCIQQPVMVRAAQAASMLELTALHTLPPCADYPTSSKLCTQADSSSIYALHASGFVVQCLCSVWLTSCLLLLRRFRRQC